MIMIIAVYVTNETESIFINYNNSNTCNSSNNDTCPDAAQAGRRRRHARGA